MTRALLVASVVVLTSFTQAAEQKPQVTTAQNQGAAPQPAPEHKETGSTEQILSLPLGDLAGAAQNANVQTANPVAGDKAAIEQGKSLFRAMNCAYCHGLQAKGVMGPDLTDTYWRYGGTPAMIYKSIAEGRPQGMPSWGKMLPSTAIWSIVAYIESLGGAYPADQHDAAMQGDLARGDTQPGAGLMPELQGSY